MKQGDIVTLRGRVVETADMGHEQNVCIEPLEEGGDQRVWLQESQVKALQSAPKNKAVRSAETK